MTETLGKVQEAVVDENAPLASNEVRGARTRTLTFGGWNAADPIAAAELVPMPEVASGSGRIFNATAYPAGTYWIAAKHSPNQGEWVTHLIKSKAPPSGSPTDGNTLWLTHSQFIPTGQTGPGGVVAADPPGLVNGQGFVNPTPAGGALSTPVISGPGSGVDGTRPNWTSGPAETGAAVRTRDDNLMRVPFVTNRILRQSFLTQGVVYVPSHPERAGGAGVGNAVRYLLFLQRGGVNLASGGTTPAVPIDFSSVLDQWARLHVRTDVTTNGGTLEDSSDDSAQVKYRIYLEGQLVSTQEPTLDASVLQAQSGPIFSGPGFAVLRGWQGDAPEAFIEFLENYAIAPAGPLRAGESLGSELWGETFGTPGDGLGASLSASKFVDHNSTADRTVRLFAAASTQATGTTTIAFKNSSGFPERITDYVDHYAPGAACSANPSTTDCRLPNGGTFDGTAMWISHSRFAHRSATPGPPAIGSDSPPVQGRRYDGTDVPADGRAHVRTNDNHLITIPFTDGKSERRSYLIEADVYVPYHVGGHEAVRVAPYARRGTQVDPAESSFEIGLIGLTSRWFRMSVRADVTTHAGAPGTADDKADVLFHYAHNGTTINWAPFGGAYVNLDNIAKLGTGDLNFGIAFGINRGWQFDASEVFIDNVSFRNVQFSHTLCSIDTDCPTGQICTDESARVGLPTGTKFCWDMACGTSSSSMCGSTSSPCGLCPSGSSCASSANCESGTSCTGGACACAASCNGKACGASDGCGKTCFCGVGVASCTAATPCEPGFVCQSHGCNAHPAVVGSWRPGEKRLGEWETHMGMGSPTADPWDLTPHLLVNHNAFGSGVNVRYYSANSTVGYRIAYKNHINGGDLVSHHFTPKPPQPAALPDGLGWYNGMAVWLSHSRFQSGAVPAIGQQSPTQTGTPWNGGSPTVADTGSAVRYQDIRARRVPIVTNQVTRKTFDATITIFVPAHSGARYGVRVSPYLQRGGTPLTPVGGVSLRSVDFANHTGVWNRLNIRADLWTDGGATDGPGDDRAQATFQYFLNGAEIGSAETADILTAALTTHTGPLIFSPSFGLRRGWEGDAPEAYIKDISVIELGQGARLAADETLGAPLYTLTFNNTPESSSLTGTGILDRGFHGHLGTSLRLFDGQNTQRSGRYITTYKNSPLGGEWVTNHFRTLVPSEDTLLRDGTPFDGTALWFGHSRFLPAGEVVTATPLVTSVGPPAIGLQSAPATGTRWNGTIGPAEWNGNDARVTNDLMDLATIPFASGVARRKSYLISMDTFVPKHAGAHALNHLETPPSVMRGVYNYRAWGANNFGALLDRWNRVDVRLDVITYGADTVSTPQELAEREVQFFVNGKLTHGHTNRLDDGFLSLAPGQPLKAGPGWALSVGWLGAAPEAFIDNITMRPITSGPTACTSDAPCLESGRICVGGTCKDPACARANPPCGVCRTCGAGTSCTSQAGCDPGFQCTNETCECVPQCAGKACGADNGCGGECECGAGTCESDMECGVGFVCGLNNGACFGGLRSQRTCWPAQCEDGIDATECGETTSPCGSKCACVNPCDADSPTSACAVGEVCRRGLGVAFNSPSRDVCLDPICPSDDPEHCGADFSLCGSRCICTPNCSAATCANPGDGCGGTCPNVCSEGQGPCTNDAACANDLVCFEGPSGSASCRQRMCREQALAPPLCGSSSATCGESCPVCTPQCGGRECGPDPACGTSCANPGQPPTENDCGSGQRCDADGQCVPVSTDAPIGAPDGQGGLVPVPELTPGPTSGVGDLSGAFSVSDRGSAEYTIPIEVPPGRAGMEPTLSLKYSGARSNDQLGIGWQLEGLSRITRCPRTFALDGHAAPVQRGPADRFCLDGKRLMALPGEEYGAHQAEYRTVIDSFSKIISYQEPGDGVQLDLPPGGARMLRVFQGPDSFRVFTKDGKILTYGGTINSIVLARYGLRHAWLLRTIEDRSGNTILFRYENVNWGNDAPGQPHSVRPKTIAYTGHGTTVGSREVRFRYETRPDPVLNFTQGGLGSYMPERLVAIQTYIHGSPVKTYNIDYPQGGAAEESQISGIRECEGTGTGNAVCKPATTFEYVSASGFTYTDTVGDMAASAQLDASGDGIPDYLRTSISYGEVEEAGILLVGSQVLADHLVDQTWRGGWGYGLMATVVWTMIKPHFWGLFADEPERRVTHDLLLGTGVRTNPTSTIANISGLPCSGSVSAVFDHDRDGRDDTIGLCGGILGGPRSLQVGLSLGNGSFNPSSVLTVPVGTIPNRNLIDGGSQLGSAPILYDADGDALIDIVSCADPYTIELRRRLGPNEGFAEPVRLETPEPPPPGLPLPVLIDERERHALCKVTRPTYNIFDIDGDGTRDLLVRDETAWKALRYNPASATPLWWQPVVLPDVEDSQYGRGLMLGDFNGDGLLDISKIIDDTVYVWINTGAGFVLRQLFHERPALALPGTYELRRTAALDYNSDGRTDFLEHWRGNALTDRVNYALLSDSDALGLGVLEATDIKRNSSSGGLLHGPFAHTADVDADGNPDVFGEAGGVYFGSGRHNRLLSKVETGLGRITTMQYDAGANYYTADCTGSTWPETCVKRQKGLVSNYGEGFRNAQGAFVPVRSFALKYKNARYNVTGHGFLGFDERTIEDLTGGSTHIAYQPVARFTTSGAPTLSTTPPYLYPLAGLPRVVTTNTDPRGTATEPAPLESDNFLRQTQVTNTWSVGISEFSRPFPRLTYRTTIVYDTPAMVPGVPDPANELTRCEELFNVDSYGNVFRHEQICTESGAYWRERTLTTSTFEPNDLSWLIGQVEYRTVETTYGSRTATQTWDPHYDERGLMNWIDRAPDGLVSERQRTSFGYNAFGNITSTTTAVASGELPRTTSIGYDGDNVFPETITNAKGHETKVRFDSRWGRPKIVVDPNGIVTRHAYDGLGELCETRDPHGHTVYSYDNVASSRTTAAGTIEPRMVATVERQGVDGTPTGATAREFDYLGRAVAIRTDGFDGVPIVSETVYDERGRVDALTLPHDGSETDIVPIESYAYDQLDRVTQITHSDETFTQRHYASRRSLATARSAWISDVECGIAADGSCATDIELSIDEEGKQNVTIRDASGMVVRSIDGENVDTVATTSDYRHGPYGRLVETTDNGGATQSFMYDDYGRLREHTTADTGTTVNTYNGFDQIKTTEDGKHWVRTFDYDALGRILSASDPDGSYTWTYDIGPNALGQISAMTSHATLANPGGQQISYVYEPQVAWNQRRGLLEGVDYTIDGVVYPVGFTYDGLGRTSHVKYPNIGGGNDVEVEYQYELSSGTLIGIDEIGGAATRPLWRVNEAFEGHLLKRETFGNGASTAYGYAHHRRWLEGIETTIDAVSVQSLDYTHFDNGQVHTRTSDGSVSREFTYDAVRRLIQLEDEWAPGISQTSTYDHDAHGNLTLRAGTEITPVPTRPHLIGTVGANVYQYDASGNLESRSGPDVPGEQQTIIYTGFDLPKTVVTGSGVGEVTTHFEYTGNEQRLVRRDPGMTRHFVGGLYQRVLSSAGTTVEERFQIVAGDRVLGEIVRTGAVDEMLYFHTDNVGTVEAVSDDLGNVATQEFSVWGETVGWAAEVTRFGFTGHQHDRDLGLIDMNGRVYDTLSSHFPTPDPFMQAPFQGQGLSRYAYVFNDPVNNLDPSGFWALAAGHAGGIVITGLSWGTVLSSSLGSYGTNMGITLLTGGYGFAGAAAVGPSQVNTSGLTAFDQGRKFDVSSANASPSLAKEIPILGFDPDNPYVKLEVRTGADMVPAGPPEVGFGAPESGVPAHDFPEQPLPSQNAKNFRRGRDKAGEEALKAVDRATRSQQREALRLLKNDLHRLKNDTGIDWLKLAQDTKDFVTQAEFLVPAAGVTAGVIAYYHCSRNECRVRAP